MLDGPALSTVSLAAHPLERIEVVGNFDPGGALVGG